MGSQRGLQILSLLLVATFSLRAVIAHADTGPYVLQSQVIIPEPQFQNSFDVVLLRDGVREVNRVRVSSLARFQFTQLAAGTYVLAVKIPGFKDVRQTVYIGGPQSTVFTTVFMERQVTLVPARSGIASVREYDGDNLVAASDLGRYPGNLAQDLQLAHQDVLQQDFESAFQELDRVVDDFPDYYPARRDRGAVYQQLGRYDDARSDYDIARRLNPSSPVPLIYRAGLSLLEAAALPPDSKRSLISEARDDLLKATQIWPQGCFAHYLLGVTYYEAEFYEEAKDSFLLALRLDPRFLETHLGLANVYIRTQEWNKALSHVNAYLADNPKSEDVKNLEAVRSRIEKMVEEKEGPKRPARRDANPQPDSFRLY